MKCSYGDDIWVIGSAFVGNNCFTCITGESFTTGDFELDKAYHKKSRRTVQKNIDDMKPQEINGFFDDDGYQVNRNLTYKPSLCLTCQLDHNPTQ